MLDGGNNEMALGTLRALRDVYRPRISELAFAYVMLAQEKGYPAPSPAGFQLDGADLRQWSITGRDGEPPLDLRGASFRGARMSGASLRNLDLEKTDFSGADLARVELIGGRARSACFAGADVSGTVFRDVNLQDTDFTGAGLHRSQFLHCRLTGVRGLDVGAPHVLFALCEPEGRYTSVPNTTPRVSVFNGHSQAVSGCAFAPDGTSLASVLGDHTLRLWDPVSGDCLAVLHGHEAGVRGCAFVPDGTRLASASWDNTLRLWDPVSGECLAVLRGHEGGVSACAFAPDGIPPGLRLG